MNRAERSENHPVPLESRVRALEVLRIALGIVWLLNLIFVVDPANGWFDSSHFADLAASFGSSTPTGPGLAEFIASNASIFAWLVALATAYLALALILGFTTRLACVLGVGVSALFLLTQWGAIWAMPGGTDVGAQPLYLVIYATLILGGAGRFASADSRVWRRWRLRFPRTVQLFAAPASFG